MNYKEVAAIVSKVWVNTEDIMKLCQCGKNNAIKIRQQIEKDIRKKGKFIPPSVNKCIPTKLVLDYIGLNEDYIFTMSSKIN